MNSFKFLAEPKLYNSKTDFIVHFSAINNKEKLFKQMGEKLNFPSYYGHNWDALSDCLTDFHWIIEVKIILVHDECPQLNEKDLFTYLQILSDAIEDWKVNQRHILEVIFPNTFKSIIQ